MATPIWLDFLCPNAHLLIIDRLSEPSSTAMLKLWRSSLDGHVKKYRTEIIICADPDRSGAPTENRVLRGSVSFSLKHRTAASSQAGYDFSRSSAALRCGNLQQ